MIPHPAYNIWEHTRETLFDLYARRARNELSEMTCHQQAAELLVPHVIPGMTVLDAGCGSGYFFWSFKNRNLPIDYHGIDYTASFIEIGRKNIPPEVLPYDRLRVEAIENLTGSYDAVFCINTLFCLPNYHQGLERLALAAKRFLIIRTTLDRNTLIRYETDDYLDEGFRGPNGLKAYFNIWSQSEVMGFLEDLGFKVQHVVDKRTKDDVEISAGKPFPYKFLFCERRERS
jgi:SAM-dependent methyltransferase